MILDYTFTLSDKIKVLLGRIKETERKIKQLSVSRELFSKIFQHNYLRQAYSSTKIEYSLISYSAVQKVLQIKKPRNEEEQEVLNVANAHIAAAQDLKKNITDAFVIDVHRQISKGLKGSITEPKYNPGKYRKIQNYLGDPFSDRVSFTFPDPKDVPKLMNKLNKFASPQWGAVSPRLRGAKTDNKIDPVLIPGIFHFIFIAIHPFINGNGRTVRVLEDFLLKKAGYNLQNLYNLSQYYYENLKDYHYYLNTGRDRQDLTGFVEFYLEGIAQSQQKVFEEKTFLERLEILHKLPNWKKMDKIDKKLLNYLAENHELTMKKAVKLTSKKLTAEAIRLRFQKYIQYNIMKKVGEFKTAKYVWPRNPT